MGEEDESKFDAAKAELFEAVGHPNRIKIIQALDQGAVGFAELKKRVGMESSGHLSFHLGKLEHLVALNADGRYALTGEGREALRMIQTVREHGPRHRLLGTPLTGRSLVAVLVVLVVAFAMVAAVQQLEIANLSARPSGTVSLDGKSFWYTVIPMQNLPADRNTSVLVDGVNFTLVPAFSGGVFASTTNASALNPSVPVTVSGTIAGANFTMKEVNGSGIPGIPGIPVTFRVAFYSNVVVRFADGKTETMYVEHVTSSGNMVSINFAPPAYPWFSSHMGPQVAVSENSTAVTLYVSTGR